MKMFGMRNFVARERFKEKFIVQSIFSRRRKFWGQRLVVPDIEDKGNKRERKGGGGGGRKESKKYGRIDFL